MERCSVSVISCGLGRNMGTLTKCHRDQRSGEDVKRKSFMFGFQIKGPIEVPVLLQLDYVRSMYESNLNPGVKGKAIKQLSFLYTYMCCILHPKSCWQANGLRPRSDLLCIMVSVFGPRLHASSTRSYVTALCTL